jgi:hypothetical protein
MVNLQDISVSSDLQAALPPRPDVRIIEGKAYVSNKEKFKVFSRILRYVLRIWNLVASPSMYVVCIYEVG